MYIPLILSEHDRSGGGCRRGDSVPRSSDRRVEAALEQILAGGWDSTDNVLKRKADLALRCLIAIAEGERWDSRYGTWHDGEYRVRSTALAVHPIVTEANGGQPLSDSYIRDIMTEARVSWGWPVTKGGFYGYAIDRAGLPSSPTLKGILGI